MGDNRRARLPFLSPMSASRTRLLGAVLLFASAAAAQSAVRTGVAAGGSPCPPAPLPLTHAPIAGLDAATVVLGQFEQGPAMLDAQGANLVKAASLTVPAGLF